MRTGDLPDTRVDLLRDPATILWVQRFRDTQHLPRPIRTTPHPGPNLQLESTWFGAVNGKGDVQGCLRFMSSNEGALAFSNDVSIDSDARRMLDGLRGQVSHVTDLAIASSAPAMATLSVLARAAVQHAVAVGQHSYLVTEVPERLIRFLSSALHLSCEIIGDSRRFSDGDDWWPVLIDGVRWLHDLRFEHPEQWRWMVEDLVISVDSPCSEIDLNELL